MAETFGTIVDKLAVVNIKIALWENERRDQTATPEKRILASESCMNLNAQRNQLVTELDEYLEAVLKDPKEHKVHRKTAIYGGNGE